MRTNFPAIMSSAIFLPLATVLAIPALGAHVTEPPTVQTEAACPDTSIVVVGTDGSDRLTALDINTCLVGLAGDDVLKVVSPGDDYLIMGGAGNDLIIVLGKPEHGLVAAGKDDDTVKGGKADDVIYGQQGRDTIHGRKGNDSLFGGADEDVLSGGPGRDLVDGGAGDDILYGESLERLLEQEGVDPTESATVGDILIGSPGNDVLLGENFLSLLSQEGQEEIAASALSGVDNILIGGPGNDALYGSRYEDTLIPGSGVDLVRAYAGDDTIIYASIYDIGPGEIIDGGSGYDELVIPASVDELAELEVDIIGFEALSFFKDLGALIFHDPERNSDYPTGWNYFYSMSANQLKDFLSSENSRLVDIDRRGADEYQVVSVVNAPGIYHADGAFWLPNLDESGVTATLQLTGARMIDLEVQVVNGVERFTASFKPNEGSAFKSWIWGYDKYATDIQALEEQGWRVTDIEVYRIAEGDIRYAFVAIANIGVDQTDTEILLQTDFSALDTYLQANPDKRLLDIEYRPDAGVAGIGLSAIAVTNKGVSWWWGVSGQDYIYHVVNNNGARLIDLEYTTSGVIRDKEYTFVAIDNTAAEARRIRPFLSAWFEDAVWSPLTERGFMVKEIGGPVISEIGGYRPTNTASVIKLAAYLAAIQEVDKGNATLRESTIQWNTNPTNFNDDCFTGQGTPSIYRYLDALPTMMWFSHNATLEAFYRVLPPYSPDAGVDTLTRRAQTEWGMPDTIIYAGCPGNDPDWKSNRTTMHDLASLYEGVQNLTLLEKDSSRSIFLNKLTNLNGNRCPSYYSGCPGNAYTSPYQGALGVSNTADSGGNSYGNAFNNLIQSERPGWSNAQIQAFLDEVIIRTKPGGTQHVDDDSNRRTGLAAEGLVISLPFRGGGPLYNFITPKHYVVAFYANFWTDPCGGGNCPQIGAEWDSDGMALRMELLRQPVREALATW